jgi:ribose 5-phosphate isomerase B
MTLIALGADHAGFTLKQHLKAWLADRGHAVLDLGTSSPEAVDYPDFAIAVARAVQSGTVQRGILVCGSGIGMAITANKIAGVRAAVAGDAGTARLCREHNDANVLALGARRTGVETAVEIVQVWLETPFAGGRHGRRLDKLAALETARREGVDVAAG